MEIYQDGILSLIFVCSLNLLPFRLLKVLSSMQCHMFLLPSSYSPTFIVYMLLKENFQPNNIYIIKKHKKCLKHA